MLDCFLCLLWKYQTFTVGLIGFCGVMLTLFQNSRLSRRQHDREISHERNALRQALSVELSLLKENFEGRSKTTARDSGKNWLVPSRISNNVYETLLPKIGLLTTKEISLVMRAYLLVSELPTRLKLLSPEPGNTNVDAGYIFVENKYIETAAQIHKNFLEDISRALDVINENLAGSP